MLHVSRQGEKDVKFGIISQITKETLQCWAGDMIPRKGFDFVLLNAIVSLSDAGFPSLYDAALKINHIWIKWCTFNHSYFVHLPVGCIIILCFIAFTFWYRVVLRGQHLLVFVDQLYFFIISLKIHGHSLVNGSCKIHFESTEGFGLILCGPFRVAMTRHRMICLVFYLISKIIGKC